ncbi:MAG: sensor histidine kinase [Bacteroidota bacterium]|nr:sensor histidine kinase [Bacteroidota bacterium]
MFLFLMASKATSQNVTFNDSIFKIPTKSRPEQVIQKINLSKVHFEKAADNCINFGIVGSEYNYFLLKLNSFHAYTEQYLSIDNTSLDTVSIYRIYNDGTSRMIYQGGMLIPFDSNNKYVWHTVPVEISGITSFYLIALKASQKNINVRYEILTRDELQQKYQDHDRMIFFYIGIVCLIIVIIILGFFLFKKPMFAAYLGYIVFAFIWIVSHYGYIFPYVYPRIPVINEIAKPVSSLCASFFLLLVLNLIFRQQLQSRQAIQQLIKGVLSILPLLIASMFLLLIPGLHYMIKGILIIAWHAGLIFTICVIVFTPVSFINSGVTAKIFTTAMFVIFTMSVVQLFANSGYIHNFFIEEHGMTMGSLLENIIIAFGLFYNLLQERKQSEIQVLALEKEQAETLKKLITVQDNERKRIAGDLHDNIGPLLAALKINFRRIINTKERNQQNELVTKTESIIDDSIAEIHNVALNLMPKGLSSNGLINTLQEYFESIQQLYDKAIIFNHQVESILNPELQINLYRIICELVLNSARHSNACNITVCINADAKRVVLGINDDGKGFHLKPGDNKKSLGLQNAESRVLYLKGKFNLKSEAGKGTQIEIEIPLQFYNIHVDGL